MMENWEPIIAAIGLGVVVIGTGLGVYAKAIKVQQTVEDNAETVDKLVTALREITTMVTEIKISTTSHKNQLADLRERDESLATALTEVTKIAAVALDRTEAIHR